MCPEGGDPESDHIGALPQAIPIEELRRRRVLHGRVGAANRVAGALEGLERLGDPPPLDRPLRDGLVELAAMLQQVAADCRVVRQLHLVNRDAVWREDRPSA